MKKTGLIIFTFIAALKVSHAQTTWGESGSRTDNRDDAGLQGNAGAISGFYQTYNPVNFPGGASNWWHLLDVRHSNPGNNYAMQFAGAFYDQDLYFRKTSNNPAQAWSKVIMATNGKVGIGTGAPAALLDVGADVSNGTLATVFGRMPEGNTQGAGTFLGVRGYETQFQNYEGKSFSIEHSFYGIVNSSVNFFRGGGMNGGFLTFNTYDNSERMRITPSGDVAIGTQDSKGYKLAVNGSTIAASVTVKMYNAWPDYVFRQAYRLPALPELETYIDQNHHLPEMPSETEVAKEGLNLGEMNRLLVKKVEELTLYLIKQAKTDGSLQKQLQAQQGEINLLKQNLKARKASGKR